MFCSCQNFIDQQTAETFEEVTILYNVAGKFNIKTFIMPPFSWEMVDDQMKQFDFNSKTKVYQELIWEEDDDDDNIYNKIHSFVTNIVVKYNLKLMYVVGVKEKCKLMAQLILSDVDAIDDVIDIKSKYKCPSFEELKEMFDVPIGRKSVQQVLLMWQWFHTLDVPER